VKVLIAEDSPQTSLILQSVVESLGHECIMASDGVEAWERFRQAQPPVVISDWLMPRMDGQELCRHIRESGQAETYFIFLTGLEDKLHLLEGQRAGANAYLTKPVDSRELQLALDRAERATALRGSARPLGGEGRAALIEQLAAMGPRLSTRVAVNGRSLTLDAAIKLIEQLPAESTVGRRWPIISIDPDPFVDHEDGVRPPTSADLQQRRTEHAEQAELVQNLVQRARAERRTSWWRKLLGAEKR
jgi:CheY-like chemotaxis protein